MNSLPKSFTNTGVVEMSLKFVSQFTNAFSDFVQNIVLDLFGFGKVDVS